LKKEVCIVIPVYQTDLSDLEKISLQQCMNILGHYPVYILKPLSLNVDVLTENYTNINVKSLDNSYFKSVESYNRMMLSSDFYQQFVDYQYIMIYQLDSFVFKDDLLTWCKKGYDYVGAPWISTQEINKTLFYWKQKVALWFKLKHENGIAYRDIIRANAVGNGGFSLRKVDKFLKAIQQHQKAISYYLEHDDFRLNEDVFWGVEVNRYQKNIKTPSVEEALSFAFETEPSLCFDLNNQQLPFGCHAWERYEFEFWKPYINKFGYLKTPLKV
jgi:hypothetical protein